MKEEERNRAAREPSVPANTPSSPFHSSPVTLHSSVCPISFTAGDTNLNRYVGNGPVNATDPSGKSWVKKIRVVVTASGHLIFENGKKLKLRNWAFRNRSIGVDELAEAGLQCSAAGKARLRRIKQNHPNLKIRYDKYAQPDFSEVAEYAVRVKGMNGDPVHDANLAWKELKKQLTEEEFEALRKRRDQVRLHHASDDTVQVVPADIHEAFAHTGPAGIMRRTGTYVSGMTYTLFAPGLAKIREGIKDDPATALEITTADIVLTASVDVLRWFDPFVEDIYECAEPEIARRVQVMSRVTEHIDDARSVQKAVQSSSWFDGWFDWLDVLRGKF